VKEASAQGRIGGRITPRTLPDDHQGGCRSSTGLGTTSLPQGDASGSLRTAAPQHVRTRGRAGRLTLDAKPVDVPLGDYWLLRCERAAVRPPPVHPKASGCGVVDRGCAVTGQEPRVADGSHSGQQRRSGGLDRPPRPCGGDADVAPPPAGPRRRLGSRKYQSRTGLGRCVAGYLSQADGVVLPSVRARPAARLAHRAATSLVTEIGQICLR
jgi:hypothetical protein